MTDAEDFAAYISDLRAHEPPEGPGVVLIEVSDGVRTETVRVRMDPGPHPVINGTINADGVVTLGPVEWVKP